MFWCFFVVDYSCKFDLYSWWVIVLWVIHLKVKRFITTDYKKVYTYCINSLVPLLVFVWSSCGRKREYPEETHLYELMTTWRQVSNSGQSGAMQACYHCASQTTFSPVCPEPYIGTNSLKPNKSGIRNCACWFWL